MLFFGCRSPTADFYFEHEWWQVMQTGALDPQHGLIAAFSRHSPQPTQQELVQMLQHAAETTPSPLLQQQQGRQQVLQDTAAPQQDAPPAAGAAGVSLSSTGSSSGRVYVTHKIREHGAAVWQLLSEQGGWVYVSGSAEKMPAGVVSALEDVAAAHGGLSAEAAAKFVRQLELTGRYHVEAWS
jgi:sulfite reductase alpha subunit-like flavoprotein